MKKIIFSLVLFKQTLNEIMPLLYSIEDLNKLTNCDEEYHVVLSIYDNSDIKKRFKNEDFKFLNFQVNYFHNPKNIGFGKANNFNFKYYSYNKNDIYIASNPDTSFEAIQLLDLIKFFECEKRFVCINPIIKNKNGHIQFSAKKDPTFFSLLIGFFPLFLNLSFLRRYDHNHKNKNFNYMKDIIPATYLSGSFLLIKAFIFKKVGGFSDTYFLHLEDADFARKCSLYGITAHVPMSEIKHLWKRGSHKSLFQIFHVIRSMFIYFLKWGLKLF